MSLKVFIFAGEPSGDLHGFHLLEQLQKFIPSGYFFGVGGPRMRSLRFETFHYQMEDFAVMGFMDVFKCLPKLVFKFYKLSHAIVEAKPSAVVLIDAPDFNLRLAKKLRRLGYRGKIVHYISPSVWAWRRNRIYTMAENLDLLLTIFPFEASHYAETSLPVTFVGNPLSEYMGNYVYNEQWKTHLNINKEAPILALFPGSRKGEVESNLSLQLEAVKLVLQEENNPQVIAISCMEKHGSFIQEAISQLNWPQKHQICLVPETMTYELMRDCQLALAKAGTVTLELGLYQKPTVVMYKVSPVNYLIAKYLVRLNLPYYCLVNIILQKEVFPECIGNKITPQEIASHLLKFYGETPQRKKSLQDCQLLSELFQERNVSEKAALAILKEIA